MSKTKKEKIAFVLGTRAEMIKSFPLMKEIIGNEDYTLEIIHTGQHDLEGLMEQFDINISLYNLTEPPSSSSKLQNSISYALKWAIKSSYHLIRYLNEIKPDYVFYHGDTLSTFIASTSSSRALSWTKKWKSCHIEAGLRSGHLSDPFPEEIFRVISDYLSDILFTVSERATNNVIYHKKLGKTVINTGNTIVDSINYCKQLKTPEIPEKPFRLATIHRNENLKDSKRMSAIVDIISSSKQKVIFPLHDNTKSYLEDYSLLSKLKNCENTLLTNLKGYTDFIHYIDHAELVYTDGGSMQEECMILQTPCIILRNTTERIETLEWEGMYLSKFDVKPTTEIAEKIIENFTRHNYYPYGKSNISHKILQAL